MFFLNKKFIKKYIIFILVFLLFYLTHKYFADSIKNTNYAHKSNKITSKYIENLNKYPIIFIGGYSAPGRDLMKSILSAHPLINCPTEPLIISLLINYINGFKGEHTKIKDFERAGFKNATIDSAASLFIHQILHTHIKHKKYICITDPLLVGNFKYLQHVFLNAKLIKVVLDIKIMSYTLMDKLEANKSIDLFSSYFVDLYYNSNIFGNNCDGYEENRCKLVKYESLVYNLTEAMSNITSYLNLTGPSLRYEKFVSNAKVINKPIMKPYRVEKLKEWIYNFRYDLDTVRNGILNLKKFGVESVLGD